MSTILSTINNSTSSSQDKSKELEFFEKFAEGTEPYNVFTDEANERIMTACINFSGLLPGMQIADLGCGWGIFTRLLKHHGLKPLGVDLCQKLAAAARHEDPSIPYVAGDVEHLPFATGSLDAILLSAILHHLPDPTACAREVYRVLKPNGIFVAFDPNRRNPFMWLYRDWDSPLYSQKGVTENERPVIAGELAQIFTEAGFSVSTNYLSRLAYRYVASPLMRKLLPIYNFIDDVVFRPQFMKPYGAFVVTSGKKP